MRILVLDNFGEGAGVDIALRARDADHDVRYWLPPFSGSGARRPYGDGMLEKPVDWKPSMDWAELIILIGNTGYMSELAEYFGKGYPIFGTNPKAAELECDRDHGQRILKDAGVLTIPYVIVNNADEALEHIVKTQKPFAIKPCKEADKSLTYVAHTPDDAIFTITRWKKENKVNGRLMLQEKIDGIEVGISGFFGPGGWCRQLEESFEHKKLMNDDLGENTGEMGTVIRHVTKSKLFDDVLEPVTDYLHSVNFVGDCNVNCMVDKHGDAWPMEFTIRLGWPDFFIRQAVIKGDPVQWIADLVHGQDNLHCSPDIAVGVCLTHGDFPRGGPGDTRPKDPLDTWVGYPIYGVHADLNLAWQQVKEGRVPMLIGDKVEDTLMTLTAGNYPLVAMGIGDTVQTARRNAYGVIRAVSVPSNAMYRTDIGDRLRAEIPRLNKHGYAVGMKYG